MSRIVSFIKKLKQKFFRSEVQPLDAPQQITKSAKSPSRTPSRETPSPVLEREPYFIQIGFDFGTSYSKCICRDIMTDKAWVFIPSDSEREELPFLISCTLQLKNGKIAFPKIYEAQYIDKNRASTTDYR